MQIISNIALISINETLLFQIISFLIFLFIFNRIMFRPMRSAVHERENYINNIEKDIVDAEKQFDSLITQIEEEKEAVRNEAFELREKLEASGSRQAAEILASTRKEIAALKDTTQKDIDGQIKAARKHVKRESEVLSLNIMEAVLQRSLKS